MKLEHVSTMQLIKELYRRSDKGLLVGLNNPCIKTNRRASVVFLLGDASAIDDLVISACDELEENLEKGIKFFPACALPEAIEDLVVTTED